MKPVENFVKIVKILIKTNKDMVRTAKKNAENFEKIVEK